MAREVRAAPVAAEQKSIRTKSFQMHLNRTGAGNKEAVVFLHGSGPGGTAWTNWHFAMPVLGDRFDCLAPDLIGFGASDHPDPPPSGMAAWIDLWMRQVIELLDTLGHETAHVVGNSLGGGIALHLANRYPQRVKRVALCGAIGVPFKINPKLDTIWGFFGNPSVEKMAEIISWFAYRPETLKDQLASIAKTRYDMAMDPGVVRSFKAMFPAPRQKHIDDFVLPDATLATIKHPVFLIHGRDDVIVPVETSFYLLQKLPNVRMHIFGQCSHWTLVEFANEFERQLRDFLTH